MKHIILVLFYFFSLTVDAATVVQGDIFPGVKHYKNFIKNSEFEKNELYVTDSSSIASRSQSGPLSGVYSLLVDGSASSQLVKFTMATYENHLKGQNCEFSGTFSGDASLYKVYVLKSAVKISAETTLTNETNSKNFLVNFPCGDGSAIPEPTLECTSSSCAAIKLDKLYAGLATNIGEGNLISEWQSYTPTYSGGGSVTTTYMKWRRVGTNAEIDGRIVLGTPTGAVTFTLPNSLTADGILPTSVFQHVGSGSIVSSGNYVPSVLAKGGLTTLTFGLIMGSNNGLTAYASWAAGETISFKASVPISGWTASTIVRMDQTNYPDTAFTPTFTGFGTMASTDFFHSRRGDKLCVHGKGVIGTPTATEGRMSLPGSLTIDSTKVASIRHVGEMYTSQQNQYNTVLGNGGQAYVTFGRVVYSGGISTISSANPNSFVSAGDTLSINFCVPITGWTETQNAPLVVGGITSGYSGVAKIESATIANTGASACTVSSTDTTASWLSGSGSNLNAGSCDLTIASGTFSAAPWMCWCNSDLDYTVQKYNCNTIVVSSTQVRTHVSTGAGTDTDRTHKIVCWGPR